MVIQRSPEQADVLDMVARLKQAADKREAVREANMTGAVVAASADDLEFPPEFYQYFTVVKAA